MNSFLFFHIGVTLAKDAILQSLLDRGIQLYIIDDLGIRPKNQTIPYCCVYQQSYDNIIQKILEAAKQMGIPINKCRFFTMADGSVDLLNQILKHFGQPPISHFPTSLKDKYWVRKRLEEEGIERLPYLILAKNPTEIPKPRQEFFPLVVKPVGSMESRNVFKVYNYSELKSACMEIFTSNSTKLPTDHGEIVLEDTYNQNAFALIETKLKGEMVSAEVIIHDKQILFTALTSKFDYMNEFLYERAHISNPWHLSEHQNRVLGNLLNNITTALQLESCILHIELFYNHHKNLFHLIEINFRLCGDRIAELVNKAYSINIMAEYLEILAGNKNKIQCKPQEDNPEKIAWIDFKFLNNHGGVFESKSETAFSSDILWRYNNGEAIKKLSTSKFYKLGDVVFSAKQDQIEERLNHLMNNPEKYYILK